MAAGVNEGKSMTDKIDNNRHRSPDPKPKNDHLGRQMHNLESPGSSVAASHNISEEKDRTMRAIAYTNSQVIGIAPTEVGARV